MDESKVNKQSKDNKELNEKFIKKLNEVKETITEANNSIVGLTEGLINLSNNVSKVKKVDEVSENLNLLQDNISKLDSCNKALEDTFKITGNFSNLEEAANTISNKIVMVKKSLEKINDFLNKATILEDDKDVLVTIYDRIYNLNKEIVLLNKNIVAKIDKYINEDVKENVNSYKNELQKLEEQFSNYKSETSKVMKELKLENQSMKQYFEEVITTNKELVSLIKTMNNKNVNAEKFMNDYMEKWYKENVNFLGMKKKK